MAVGNRTEIKTEVDSDLVATVDLSILNPFLKDDLIESIVFRKDIIASETPGGGTVTIDYSNKDTATVSVASNLAVSFTNLQNGDVKYLAITKLAANAITFSGATDISQRKTYINTLVTVVHYEVREKNGIITVESINIDNDISANLLTKVIEIGDWDMDTNLLPASTIPHGLTLAQIRFVSASIRADVGAGLPGVFPIWSAATGSANDPGGIVNAGTTNIGLSRRTGGFFDATDFDATSYNRGWIKIEYEPV